MCQILDFQITLFILKLGLDVQGGKGEKMSKFNFFQKCCMVRIINRAAEGDVSRR